MINKNSKDYITTLETYLKSMAGENPTFAILTQFKSSKFYNKKDKIGPAAAFKEFLGAGEMQGIPLTDEQLTTFFKNVMLASPRELERMKNKFNTYSNIIYRFVRESEEMERAIEMLEEIGYYDATGVVNITQELKELEELGYICSYDVNKDRIILNEIIKK